MSDVGLILNGFLGLLLIGALVLGWRLDLRLKALRASHQSFAQAVGDLDRAAARAEQGLSDLRVATDEATETLAGRIERAGSLASKLERLTAEAAKAEARLAAAPPIPAPNPSRAALSERPARPAPAPAKARADLILEDEPPAQRRPPEPAPRPPLEARLERLRAMARPPEARRRLDDDLFEAAPAARAGGARR